MSSKTVEECYAEIKEFKKINPNWMANDVDKQVIAGLMKEIDRITQLTQGN